MGLIIKANMGLHIGEATSITFRTLPYIFMRLLVYSLFGFVFCIYWVLVYFVGQGAQAIHEYARVGVWIIAILLPFPLIRLLQEYVLYVLKAGHVAVMAELATKGSLPKGVGQIAWGKEKVMKTFKQTSVLFLVDRLVTGVIAAINGFMSGIGNAFSGIPGLQGVVKLANLVLRFSLTYVDEAILARNFIMEKETVWQSAQTGLVLYAQIWKQILGTAIILGITAAGIYVVLVILFLVPFLALGAAFPALKIFFIVAAFVFAYVIKLALFDPWTLANMIVTYLKETEGLTPDKSWEEKLETVSKKFRIIKEKAQGVVQSASK